MKLFRVLLGTHEMEGHIGFISYYPAVVRRWRNVEQLTGTQLYYGAISECGCGNSRYRQPHVRDRTALLAKLGPHMFGPLPAGLVSRSAYGHAADFDYL